MAKRRKKSQPVVMPKVESNRLVIALDPTKVARGHQPHTTGSGAHDNRPKRLRTRSAAKRAALAEYR